MPGCEGCLIKRSDRNDAHFFVNGEEFEVREVEDKWLLDAWASHENVLLKDGNPYQIVNVDFAGKPHARVEVVAPRVAPGG